MITLSNEHAHALSRLVTWFQRMIVDRNIGTAELTAEYCEELKQALSTGNVPEQGSNNILRSKENEQSTQESTVPVRIGPQVQEVLHGKRPGKGTRKE